MFYILLVVIIVGGLVVWAVRSPSTRLEAVQGWGSLHKLFSVRLAALVGSLSMIGPVLDQIQTTLPQIEALGPTVQFVNDITNAQWYKTMVGGLAFLIIIARNVKLPPKPPENPS